MRGDSERGRDKPLRTGVCAAPVLDRSVRKRLGTLFSEYNKAENGRGMAVSVPALPGKVYCGKRAVTVAAGELLAANCIPESFYPVILLPPGSMESELRSISDEIGEACRQERMTVRGVHAEVTEAVTAPVVIGTAFGTAVNGSSEGGQTGPEGLDLVMTGFAASEAAWLAASQCREELEKRFPFSFVARCLRLGEELQAGRAGRILQASACSEMVYVSSGGLYAALWKLMERCGCGFSVDVKSVPILQESIEIAEYFNYDPFAAASGGCFLAVTEDSERLTGRLREEGIYACVIGRMDSERKGRSGKLCSGEELRYLDLPPADAVMKVLGDQGRR